MGYRLITQIILIVTGVLVLVLYVQPTFAGITHTKDQIYQYQTATKNATQFNQALSGLIQKSNSFSAGDISALHAFLPPKVDPIQVISDVSTIAAQTGMTVSDMKAAGNSSNSSGSTADTSGATAAPAPTPATPMPGSGMMATTSATTTSLAKVSHQDFTVSVTGSYANFKQFLLRLAQNQYQIDVIKLSFNGSSQSSGASTGGTGAAGAQQGSSAPKFDLTLRTYAMSY